MANELKPEPPQPADEAGSANAEEGVVVLDGPGSLAASIKPDPAEETGRRLIDAAKVAREQRDGLA